MDKIASFQLRVYNKKRLGFCSIILNLNFMNINLLIKNVKIHCKIGLSFV